MNNVRGDIFGGDTVHYDNVLCSVFPCAAAMAATKDTTVMLPALQKLNQELAKMVEDGSGVNFEAMRSDRLEEFLNVDCEVSMIALRPMLNYLYCLKAVGRVKTRAELEEMWKGSYHDEEVRECVEELLSLEESLQELYDDIDVEIQKAEDRLAFQNITKVGDKLPEDLALVKCRSREVVKLEEVLKQSKFTLLVSIKFYF